VEYWPIFDPSGQGEGREARLDSYRKARDEIIDKLIQRWGPALEA
jgi:arsenate reductase